MDINIQAITKQFGAYTALDAVDLHVRDGELLALLGPSGSGKTTLLRIIAGLENADSGAVLFGGENALERHPRDRGVGFVFQHYALFRHMTVFDNVAFGLTVRPRSQRPPKAEIAARVTKLLQMVQLDWLADRYPSQLSGGQRQRVALARALAVEPKVLLLDEPFGALDAKVRKELRRWLRRLHDDMGVTSVFVTHDQEEALELADRVVVMNKGNIEQVGSPAEVYRNPTTAFVYEFLGDVNRLECAVEGGGVRLAGQAGAVLGGVSGSPGPAVAYVRPHDVELTLAGPNDAGAGFGVVRHVHEVGPTVRAEVDFAGATLEAAVILQHGENGAAVAPWRQGDRVRVGFRRGVVFIDERGGKSQPLALTPFHSLGGPAAHIVAK